jgi:hypothetical protein
MECGVVVIDRAEKFSDRNINGEFFFQFASERFLRSFSGLHFSAWKFPTIFEFSVTSLGCENFVAVFDNACYYFDAFHDCRSFTSTVVVKSR